LIGARTFSRKRVTLRPELPQRRRNAPLGQSATLPENFSLMTSLPKFAWLSATAVLLFSQHAIAQQRAQYEALVATHARANNVPEVLVHRVIVRESKYHPDLVGRGGTIGLMQIKLATARGLGYTGDAAGLRDPDTNLTYGVKYLGGAWRAANSDHVRAMHYYASGYYYVAKRQRREPKLPAPVLASVPPKEIEAANDGSIEAAAEPKQAVKPQEMAGPPMQLVAKPAPAPKRRPKKLAEAKVQVPRPPAAIGGAQAAKPR
jgi:soluble lytic murein transglycosylase-like protein